MLYANTTWLSASHLRPRDSQGLLYARQSPTLHQPITDSSPAIHQPTPVDQLLYTSCHSAVKESQTLDLGIMAFIFSLDFGLDDCHQVTAAEASQTGLVRVCLSVCACVCTRVLHVHL